MEKESVKLTQQISDLVCFMESLKAGNEDGALKAQERSAANQAPIITIMPDNAGTKEVKRKC